MDATKFIKNQIEAAVPDTFKNLSALAEKAGVNQPNLSEFMNGKRKSMNLETAWKIFHALGLEVRPRDFALPEGLTLLPVCGSGGAGRPMVDVESEIIFHIAVPQQYIRPNIKTLLIKGESMEPSILDRSVVGVNTDCGDLIQGKIYAVRLPYEGIVVKRLFIDHVERVFILRSDNQNGDYPDIRIPFDETAAFIHGQVLWVLQSYEKIVI